MDEMEFDDWQVLGQAEIVSLDELCQMLDEIEDAGEVRRPMILTSGGFDPVHPGHISVFTDCRLKTALQTQEEEFLDAILVVIVNGDDFLTTKKGRAFMPLKVRSQIVASMRGIDIVVPFTPSEKGDMTVCEALRRISPDAFAKGGDRTNIENIPEWGVCVLENIEVVTGCGDEKHWSSSNFLKDHLSASQ